MEINEIWYECYATGDKCRLTIFNYLQSVISRTEWLKVVRCNTDNTTAHATLHIQPNLAKCDFTGYVHKYVIHN
jgi:hypothetical protein